jgi:hypothetical protein
VTSWNWLNQTFEHVEAKEVFVKYSAYTREPLLDDKGHQQTDDEGKVKKRLTLATTPKSTPREFLQLLGDSLTFYAQHKHLYINQALRQKHLSLHMPPKSATMSADFGENYTALHGDEAQSEYWIHNSVSVFIVITSRWIPEVEGEPRRQHKQAPAQETRHPLCAARVCRCHQRP